MRPKRTHLELSSGIYLDFVDPKPEDILLKDIALSLSNTCRWGGHCERYMSVAEHAVLVHDIVAARGVPPELRLAALHHDDHESYVGDLPTPLKNALGEVYYEITGKLDKAIGTALDIDPSLFHHPMVKEADALALFLEAEQFKPSKGVHWAGRPDVVEMPVGVFCEFGRPPEIARRNYRARHAALLTEVAS